MAKSGKSNPTFWDIKNYLPSESRHYVMKLITMNVLFKNYASYQKNDLQFEDIMREQMILVPVEPQAQVL